MIVRFKFQNGTTPRHTSLIAESVVVYGERLDHDWVELRLEVASRKVFNQEREVGTFFVDLYSRHSIRGNLIANWYV